MREQIKPAGAVVARRQKLTHEEILHPDISAAIGVGQPQQCRVKSSVEGTPAYSLTRERLNEFKQGRGPGWKEGQRRKRELNSGAVGEF